MTVADILADIRVSVGFGVNAVGSDYFVLNDPLRGELDNAVYLLAPETVFIDVTDHVAAITIDRGREREIDEYRTGTATVVFNDDDRTFDPANDASPYAGQITPMRRINIWWQSHLLFVGWVDDWFVTYEPGDRLSRVTAKCFDSFGILASQELDVIAAAHAGDTSGERVERVLDLVSFPSNRNIDAGVTTVGDTTFGSNALTYLQAVTRAEAGYLFVAANGELTFKARTAVLNVDSDLVVSDDRTAGIPYRTINQRSAADLLYTRVTGQSETTTNPLESVNAAAADDFLVRTLALGTLFTETDAQTQNILNYYQSRFSRVENRFGTAQFNLAALAASEVDSIVSLDLTDVVNVERLPMGVGAMIARLSMIDGIKHNIRNGGWTTELSFANVDTRAFFTLNDAVLGELDAYQLAF